MSNNLPTDLSPWRDVVRTAAHDASVVEMRAGQDTQEVCFNYRWEHIQAVVRLAIHLAELTKADEEVVEAAAWQHDITKGRSEDHGRDGAIAAQGILARTDFLAHKIEAVADAISKHVGLWTDVPVEPLEAAVVWDADKLSKLGATAALHFAGNLIARHGATTEQVVESLPGTGWQEAPIRSLNTAPARAAARVRWQAFRAFCRQAALEIGGDDLQVL